MGFGNFMRGLAAQVNPFDKGKTYGSYNSPSKKKRPEDDPGNLPVGNANPTQRITVDRPVPQAPQVQKPANIFDTLNKNLTLGQDKPGVVPVFANTNTQPSPSPQPGAVVRPTEPQPSITVPKVTPALPPTNNYDQQYATAPPKQSIWNKIRDVIDANTKADQYRRGLSLNAQTPANRLPSGGRVPLIEDRNPGALKLAAKTIVGSAANVPEVALAAGRAGTGIVQGALNLPHDLTALTAGGTEQLQEHMNNPVTRFVNRGAQDLNTGVKTATRYGVNDVFDPLNRRLDDTAKIYERNVPGATAGASVYRNTQIPINALAVLATMGAGAAGETGDAAANASKLGRVKLALENFLNKPLSANEDNLISRTGQSVISKARPVAEALNAPVKSTKKGINVVRDILGNRGVQTAERGAVDAGELGNLLTDAQAQAQELATTQIPVSTGVSVNEVPSEPVNIPVRNANTPGNLIQEVGGDAKTATTNAQAAENAVNVRRVEAAKNADNVVRPDRSIEGIQKPTPTFLGQAKGPTQIEIDTERAMLDDALANKEITKTEHKAANKALDETTSTDAEPPKGKPITVKEVNGIDVADQTNVPQGLPEKPGTVRVTQSTEPSNAKSEAIASQTPVVADTKAPVADTSAPSTSTKAAAAENLPGPNESDESFLKRVASDMQTNIQRAVDSIKITKKMTKAERAQRAAAGQKAYEEAKAAGKSIAEQEAARKGAYSGGFDRMEYKGTPVHSEDEQRLRDMIDQHYKDMPYQAGNVREAFGKLFHSGEPGYYSDTHIIRSDIKNIRKFLNESVPGVDGSGGLGDFAESAIEELSKQEKGPGFIANAIGLQRALRFTADISATGRQALAGAVSHPIEFAKAAKKSFEVMFSHEKYQKYVSELASNKEANYINDRLGAYLSVLNDDISKADDIYRNSGWAHKIPGVNRVVAASERQYNTLLTEMRRYQGGQAIHRCCWRRIGNLGEKLHLNQATLKPSRRAIGVQSRM
jgi:hypothetical protein